MKPITLKLLLAALSLLALLVVVVASMLRARRQKQRFQARLAEIATPHARIDAIRVMGRPGAAMARPLLRLVRWAASLFGFDPARVECYPWPWWMVLGGGLLIARFGSELAMIVLGPLAVGSTPMTWVFLCRTFFKWCESRRTEALYTQFPDALAMVVRSVRVGIPLSEGIRSVAREAPAPTKVEFARLSDQVAIGMTLEDAVRDMAVRNRLPEYRFFATVLSLQGQTGGGLSESLEILSDVMRKRLALRSRAHALAAEAKTSIAILASLPFVSGGALAVLNPAYIGRLFTDPSGQNVLVMAICSLGSGLMVMRSMIKRTLS